MAKAPEELPGLVKLIKSFLAHWLEFVGVYMWSCNVGVFEVFLDMFFIFSPHRNKHIVSFHFKDSLIKENNKLILCKTKTK